MSPRPAHQPPSAWDRRRHSMQPPEASGTLSSMLPATSVAAFGRAGSGIMRPRPARLVMRARPLAGAV